MDLAWMGAPRVLGWRPFAPVESDRNRYLTAQSRDGRYVAVLERGAFEVFSSEGFRLASVRRYDLREAGCFLDDRRLLVACGEGKMLLFDVAAFPPATRLDDGEAWAAGDPVSIDTGWIKHLVLSPDGSTLAAACEYPLKRVYLLDAATLQVRAELRGLRRDPTDLAFSADGRWLAVAGDKQVRVYDLAPVGRRRKVAPKPKYSVGDMNDRRVAWWGECLFTLGSIDGLRGWNGDQPDGRAGPRLQDFVLDGPCVLPSGNVMVVTGSYGEPSSLHCLGGERFDLLSTRRLDQRFWDDDSIELSADETAWALSPEGDLGLRARVSCPGLAGRWRPRRFVIAHVHPSGRWLAHADKSVRCVVGEIDADRPLLVVREKPFPASGTNERQVSFGWASDAPRLVLHEIYLGLLCYDVEAGAFAWEMPTKEIHEWVLPHVSATGDEVLLVGGDQHGSRLWMVTRDGVRWRAALDFWPMRVRWEEPLHLLGQDRDAWLSRATGEALPRPGEARLPAAEGLHRGIFSDDGSRIAHPSGRGYVVVREASSGREISRVKWSDHGLRSVGDVAWTKEGELLVVADRSRVEVRDPVTFARRSSLDTSDLVDRILVVDEGRRLVLRMKAGHWLIYDAPP